MSTNTFIGEILQSIYPFIQTRIQTLNENVITSNRIEMELINRKIISEEECLKAFAYTFQLQLFSELEVSYQLEVVRLVTPSYINYHKIIPLLIQENQLFVGAMLPISYQHIQTIKALGFDNIKIVLMTTRQFEELYQHLIAGEKIKLILETLEDESEVKETPNQPQSDIEQTPIVQLVDSILQEAIMQMVSDIHFEPLSTKVRVRFRIDGLLVERSFMENNVYQTVLSRLKIISGIDITKRKIPQDGHLSYPFDGNTYDFRLSTIPVAWGEKLVIRVLDQTRLAYERSQLGFTKRDDEKVTKMLSSSYGMILLVGPTGCGKTTTLYAFLRELNRKYNNIVTVEDPVEYTIDGINQVQVNPMVDLTFAKAMRSILRQDPDVMMIGEIRDEESARIAMRASITGHLILSTLHTNQSTSAISRLLDMGIEHYLIAEALLGVIAQRLVRKLCTLCKIEREIYDWEKVYFPNMNTLFDAKGCYACQMSGYRGRFAIHEVLLIDDELKNLIHQHATSEEIKKIAIQKGMKRLREIGLEAVREGKTTLTELMRIGINIMEETNEKSY